MAHRRVCLTHPCPLCTQRLQNPDDLVVVTLGRSSPSVFRNLGLEVQSLSSGNILIKHLSATPTSSEISAPAAVAAPPEPAGATLPGRQRAGRLLFRRGASFFACKRWREIQLARAFCFQFVSCMRIKLLNGVVDSTRQKYSASCTRIHCKPLSPLRTPPPPLAQAPPCLSTGTRSDLHFYQIF